MSPAGQLLGLLGRVRTLSFVARSSRTNGWNGEGHGTVVVEAVAGEAVTFAESGLWRSVDGYEARFRNVFRWSVSGDLLRVEHLRYGEENPVHLFDLARTGEREWRSASPHLCRQDCYAAVLLVPDERIVVRWSIDGPRKEQTIEYVYCW